jgi:hypothetical protein
MRVALLASTFALLVGSPAFAQCVYVACNGGAGAPPGYGQPVYQQQQQPVYQAPAAQPRPAPNMARADYDAGYEAGLAARPAQRATHGKSSRSVSRSGHRSVTVARGTGTSHHAGRGTGNGSGRGAATSGARRHTAVASRPVARTVVRPVVRQAARVAPRPVVRQTAVRQTARSTYSTSYTRSGYTDPIKDRARTYGSQSYGSATSMASLMSTTTTWVGPASISTQNGQSCGWGARIVTNNHGQAQRQAMWVCQCPQGWRPPGY